jgi:hypothetical protein
MKRVGKSGPVSRVDLSLRSHQKDCPHILPLQLDSPDAFYPVFIPSADVDVRDDLRPLRLLLDLSEVASTLVGPGPWSFYAALCLPSCSVLRFTNRTKKSNVVVGHKLVFRAERGNETEREGKNKLFDIIVHVSTHVLSCRCNPDWTALPVLGNSGGERARAVVRLDGRVEDENKFKRERRADQIHFYAESFSFHINTLIHPRRSILPISPTYIPHL